METEELKIGFEAVLKATKFLQTAHPAPYEGKIKESFHSIVTQYDLKTQEIIVKNIQKYKPKSTIISEEMKNSNPQIAPPFWILDPIDGTSYFIRGLPNFSISLAFVTSDGISIGIISLPATNELFYAEQGKGAFLNGTPIKVSKVSDLNNAIISFGHSFLQKLKVKSPQAELISTTRSIRAGGSCAQELAYLASGRIDALITYSQSSWDFAAGMLITREAGGIVTNQFGKQLHHESIKIKNEDIVASNGTLQPSCLFYFK